MISISFPLTVKTLETALKSIISEINKTYEVKETLLKTLYSKSVNAVVTTAISVVDYDALLNAIKGKKRLVCSNGTISIVAGRYKSVTADNYTSWEMCVIGALNGSKIQRVILGVENLAGAMRLCTKTVTDL